MDTKYRAVRIQENLDGSYKDISLSSWKDTEKEAEGMVRTNIYTDMKDDKLLMACNLVLGSDGSVGLNNYFTHDASAEQDFFVAIESIWYTEESGKNPYNSAPDYANKWDAEAQYWNESGKARKDATVDFALNIVLNRHGGIETSQNRSEIRLVDAWEQYPIEPIPEPNEEV